MKIKKNGERDGVKGERYRAIAFGINRERVSEFNKILPNPKKSRYENNKKGVIHRDNVKRKKQK